MDTTIVEALTRDSVQLRRRARELVQRAKAACAAAVAHQTRSMRVSQLRFCAAIANRRTAPTRVRRRLKTYARIQSGELAFYAEATTWYGRGRYCPCDGCDEVIGYGETEAELELEAARSLHFHVECLQTWRRACPAGNA